MPRYSRSSLAALRSTVAPIQAVFEFVVKRFDNTINEGHRGQRAQNRAFRDGHSKVIYPNGAHNSMPSRAIDAGPYDPEKRGIDWDIKIAERNDRGHIVGIRWKAVWNLCRFYYFAGYVMGVAASQGRKWRWGGDWDGDTEVDDQSFRDLVHFEDHGSL